MVVSMTYNRLGHYVNFVGNFSNISPRWWQGAYHSSDLPLVFGTHGIARGESTPFEVEVSREMQDYFLAFAEDPVRGLPAAGWHGYSGDSGGQSALFGWKDSVVSPISDRELESGCDEGISNWGPNPPTS
jgi:acetylcholinesterase